MLPISSGGGVLFPAQHLDVQARHTGQAHSSWVSIGFMDGCPARSKICYSYKYKTENEKRSTKRARTPERNRRENVAEAGLLHSRPDEVATVVITTSYNIQSLTLTTSLSAPPPATLSISARTSSSISSSSPSCLGVSLPRLLPTESLPQSPDRAEPPADALQQKDRDHDDKRYNNRGGED